MGHRAWGMGEEEGGKGKYFFFKSPLPFTLFLSSNPIAHCPQRGKCTLAGFKAEKSQIELNGQNRQ
jgi:hypothetical protein